MCRPVRRVATASPITLARAPGTAGSAGVEATRELFFELRRQRICSPSTTVATWGIAVVETHLVAAEEALARTGLSPCIGGSVATAAARIPAAIAAAADDGLDPAAGDADTTSRLKVACPKVSVAKAVTELPAAADATCPPMTSG